MEVKRLAEMLRCPCGCGQSLVAAGEVLTCTRSGRQFPIIHNRMIDLLFDGTRTAAVPAPAPKGLLFAANEFYNTRLEQKIAGSVFAAGGLSALFLRKKILSWLGSVRQGIVLDVGSGDQKWKRDVENRLEYISLDYVPAAASSPWRESYPQVNGDATDLPFKDGVLDAVMSVFVIEHVRSPQLLLRESVRVLKPGGHLLLVGPGDILMSHGEPYNYFNMTRYAYEMLLEEMDVEVLEEYYPSLFWMSITSLIYQKIVRNDIYNRSRILKLAQVLVLGLSLILSPIANLVAWLLDLITPFDRRGYASYAILVRKKYHAN